MKIAVFSSKTYDQRFFEAANANHGHELKFFEPRLTSEAVGLAEGFSVVCQAMIRGRLL